MSYSSHYFRGPKAALVYRFCPLALAALLAACGSAPKLPPQSDKQPVSPPVAQNKPRTEPALPVLPAAGSGRGGYYQDDGPGDSPPPGLHEVPDAEPRIEVPSRTGNKPYVVFGKTYTPITDERPFVQRGTGTWYGKKFHGQRTSSGEPYDMYKMTAAHPTLPIPSFARVTNLSNGKQVVVRVNDRGPFHSKRVIDLSYTAALKLGLLGRGSHEVEVERLLPDEIARMQAAKQSNRPESSAALALAAKPEDARQLRLLDQGLRNERILPAPVSDQVALTADAPVANLRIEQSLAQGDAAAVKLLPVTPPASVTTLPTATVGGVSNQAATAVVGGGAFYLQLGAYSQAENAEAEKQKLSQSNLPSLEIVQSGNLYRLFSGPFASRAAAQLAAQLAQGRALVVQR